MELQQIKQRFQIIGNDTALNQCLERAIRVAPTDISVLITGESGVGKEVIPKIIHQNSYRKHANYIAINCGAIPEGTIDSELFGHEKGAFTGAVQNRKGYFEVADKGTVFLDEVGELPLTTQVRLLRVLENKEFIKVGASKTQKTDVRIIAATNVKMKQAIRRGKFREDLFYRLSTIEINLPPLRQRANDIYLLFRKFALDFAEKYKMPAVHLKEEATALLLKYDFPGNIRQLRNIAEQISIIEEKREINAETLKNYLPQNENLPILNLSKNTQDHFAKEKDFMYKALLNMKKELNELKKTVFHLSEKQTLKKNHLIEKKITPILALEEKTKPQNNSIESLSLEKKEIEIMKKSLQKNNKNRKLAAKELGISERTLYRKIKQYNL